MKAGRVGAESAADLPEDRADDHGSAAEPKTEGVLRAVMQSCPRLGAGQAGAIRRSCAATEEAYPRRTRPPPSRGNPPPGTSSPPPHSAPHRHLLTPPPPPTT